jgi:transcriptional regulator CtsR|nr:MAG TPA: CtsR-like protein [Caudoviricetes sp.]
MPDKTSVIDDQPMLTHDQFQRELSYRAAISVARRLLENKLITRKEFVRIDAVLRRKFSPVWGGLYPDNG